MSKRSSPEEPGIAPELVVELRTVLSRLKRRMREHGGRNDLTPSQIAVLLRLEKDGSSTISALARAEAMRPQSMSAILTSLQQSGLLASTADPSDGRQTLIALSNKCKKMLRETRAAREDWLTQAILRKLSPQEQQQIAKTLPLLSRLADD